MYIWISCRPQIRFSQAHAPSALKFCTYLASGRFGSYTLSPQANPHTCCSQNSELVHLLIRDQTCLCNSTFLLQLLNYGAALIQTLIYTAWRLHTEQRPFQLKVSSAILVQVDPPAQADQSSHFQAFCRLALAQSGQLQVSMVTNRPGTTIPPPDSGTGYI